MSVENDVFHVVISAYDPESLHRLLTERHDLDVGCRLAPRRTQRGIEIDAFTTRWDATELAASPGIAIEVGRNVTEESPARLSEVGDGDRFDGGRSAPTGLGEAT